MINCDCLDARNEKLAECNWNSKTSFWPFRDAKPQGSHSVLCKLLFNPERPFLFPYRVMPENARKARLDMKGWGQRGQPTDLMRQTASYWPNATPCQSPLTDKPRSATIGRGQKTARVTATETIRQLARSVLILLGHSFAQAQDSGNYSPTRARTPQHENTNSMADARRSR